MIEKIRANEKLARNYPARRGTMTTRASLIAFALVVALSFATGCSSSPLTSDEKRAALDEQLDARGETVAGAPSQIVTFGESCQPDFGDGTRFWDVTFEYLDTVALSGDSLFEGGPSTGYLFRETATQLPLTGSQTLLLEYSEPPLAEFYADVSDGYFQISETGARSVGVGAYPQGSTSAQSFVYGMAPYVDGPSESMTNDIEYFALVVRDCAWVGSP